MPMLDLACDGGDAENPDAIRPSNTNANVGVIGAFIFKVEMLSI